MLKELVDLSQYFELPPIGFAPCVVHWEFDLSHEKPAIKLLIDTSKKKPKHGLKKLVPTLRRNADFSFLIDDSAEYVFGVGSRGEKRHNLYLKLLDKCIEETEVSAAIKVKDFLETSEIDEIQLELEKLLEEDKKREENWWAKDRIIFTINGKSITLDSPKIRQFWTDYYIQQQNLKEGICSITGQEMSIVDKKMPATIKGVPNTQTSGGSISSFSQPAYCTHGWSGNNNVSIGFKTAIESHQVLDLLLNKPENHFRLGNQVFVFWGDTDGEGINPDFWSDPNPTLKIFESIDRPKEYPGSIAVSKYFHLAVLKGNKGRIALVSWNKTTSEKIKDSITNFINCQQLNPSQWAKPIWILTNCAFLDPKKEYTDRTSLALVKAALLGENIPEDYAIKVIERICIEQDVFKNLNRAKALAFYLQNTMNKRSSPQSEEFAYALGRIAFLMHRAQIVAQNLQREDTSVSRSLRALSTTPAQVFPRLYEGCTVYHLEDRAALSDSKRGQWLRILKRSLDKEFEQLIDYSPEVLPNLFTVRQQAQFFLGFATRRAEWFRKKDKEDQDIEI